jgi:hypothetical protein
MNANRLFQITEADLAELEPVLPQIGETLTPHLTNGLRVKLRRVQTILSNVRWGYGPPREVRVIDCGGDDQTL